MPALDRSDIVSYTRLDPESAERIRGYHGQFDYVTRTFAEFALMWAVLTRLGGVRHGVKVAARGRRLQPSRE